MKILLVTTEWPTDDDPNAVPFLTQQVDYLNHEGIVVKVFHFRGEFNPINYLRAWWALHFEINQSDFDIVHAHWGYAAIPVLPKKGKLVITFHGSDLQGVVGKNGKYLFFKSFLLKNLSRFSAIMADKTIVVSERLVHYLPHNVHPSIIPGGVDIGKFYEMSKLACRNELGLPLNNKIIIFPGNPDNPVKRFKLANDVINIAKARYPDLIMVPLLNIPHEMIPLYLNAADAILMTSFHEGSPTIIKEALCCGLPVISVNVGDVYEQIGELEGCVIVDQASAENLSNALISTLLLSKRPNATQKQNQLNETVAVSKILDIYKKVVSGYCSF